MLQLSRFEAEVLRTSYRKIVPELRTETHLLVPGRYAWQTLSEHLTFFWRLIFVFRTLPFQNACQNTRCPRTLLRTLYSVKPFVKCSAKLTNAWHFSCSNIANTVLIGYCDYHPVTKWPRIGCCDYSQMSFYYSRIIALWQLSACDYFLAESRGRHNIR